MDYRRFNRLMTLVAGVLATIAVTNALVDPYGLWGSPALRGLNAAKPSRAENDRVYIAAELHRFRPRAIILGTSTARHIDPEHFGDLSGVVAYNTGVANASPREMKALLDCAIRMQPEVSSVIIGLDFLSFNANNPYPPTFSEALLGRYPWPTTDLLATVLSGDALVESAKTVSANVTAPDQATYRREAPVDDDHRPGRPEAFRTYLPVVMANPALYPGYELDESRARDLEAILALCEDRGIEVRMFITPMHAAHLDAIYDTGLGDEYELWVRRMAASGPVWDFSGYNSVTTEPVRDTMDFYRDPLHFNSDVGHMMLSRIYDDGVAEVPDDFGVLVTADEAEEHVARLRSSRDAWLRSEESSAVRSVLEAGD